MKTFDKSTQRRTTDCWLREFPGFDAWRPLRLLRRIGPILQGVTLERSTRGDYYFATSHVHSLTREFPVISLSLSHRLLGSSGQPLHIAISDEDVSSFARELVEQTSHSLREAPPSSAELIAAYHEFALSQQQKGQPPAVMELEDSVFSAAFTDNLPLADAGIDIARQLVNVWPRHRLPLGWQGADIWLHELRSKAADRDSLAVIVQNQLTFHKLAGIRFTE